MAGRGRRGPSRRPRGPPRQDYYPEAVDIASEDLEMDEKKISIELKSNDQGKFVKVIESQQSQVRGRIIFSADKAFEFRSILNEFVAEYERLSPLEDPSESERLKTDSFNQGRRRYYVDLRQNQRGRFLKVTMLAGSKTFVAIPGDQLKKFRDSLASLLDAHVTEGEDAEASGGRAGVSSSRPPPQRSREQRSPPQAATKVLPSKEVRAGGKRFYFDVEQNDRGTFIKLSEVLNNGRRNRINIPQSCWSKMSDTFSSYAKEMPYLSGEDSTGSGSDDN